MSRQCECGNAADEIVFGLRHACEPKPTLPGLVPSWRFVVPEYDPAERPFETTLSDGDGDLG